MNVLRRTVAGLLTLVAGMLITTGILAGQVHSELFTTERVVAVSDVLVKDPQGRDAVAHLAAERTVNLGKCVVKKVPGTSLITPVLRHVPGINGVVEHGEKRVKTRLVKGFDKAISSGKLDDAWHDTVAKSHRRYVSDLSTKGADAVPYLDLGFAAKMAAWILSPIGGGKSTCVSTASTARPFALLRGKPAVDAATALVALDHYWRAPLLMAAVLILLDMLVMWRQSLTAPHLLGIVARVGLGAMVVAGIARAAVAGMLVIASHSNVDVNGRRASGATLIHRLLEELLRPIGTSMVIVMVVSAVAVVAALIGRSRLRKAQRDTV